MKRWGRWRRATARILERRFGLRDGQPRSLEEIAREFGLTRERIRQIEGRGLLKLRESGRRGVLAEFAEAQLRNACDRG